MQSSKQASKRAKKDRIAIRAALKDDDGGLIVSSDDSESSSSPFSSPTSQPHSPPKKKKRGPAKINFIPPMDGKRLKVRFNERGQPVGKTSNRLVSFIGCLVRRMVPITLSTWHKVDNECRERLRVCVKILLKSSPPCTSSTVGGDGPLTSSSDLVVFILSLLELRWWFRCLLVGTCKAVVVSVNYRRAYDDG
ncbi:hypothetical protein LWI29_036538 [Acer saccharum]|uniref:Uncharacterized protein n=1 Tax=Acer saccharum TaxID=4024 RepID=A0AA39SYR9_ACESA|nr:hypothetical protein LWI29_036538 [Acer saccharum]